MTEFSFSVDTFLSTAKKLDPPTDPQTIHDLKFIVLNSLGGHDYYNNFKTIYPDAPMAKMESNDFNMALRIMQNPERANHKYDGNDQLCNGLTWKECYQQKLDKVMNGGSKSNRSKRSKSKHNKTSKRNKIRRKRTLRGGKDRGSPTKNPTNRASISREHFNALVGRNIERMRLQQELLRRRPTALETLMAAQEERR